MNHYRKPTNAPDTDTTPPGPRLIAAYVAFAALTLILCLLIGG